MKILMLTDRMGLGGAETHVALLSRGLSAMGHEVCVLSAGGCIADELEAEGIPQIRLPVQTKNPFRWLQLRRRIRRVARAEDFDVLHAHARVPAFLIRGIRHAGYAELVTVHARFSLSPLRRMLSNWGSQTVAVSEDLRTYVCDAYGVPAEQVHVIANGIDCAHFSPRARASFPPLHTPEPTRILFASRLDADCSRGAELLCALAPVLHQRFPNLRIGIAGGGNALPHLRAMAREQNQALGENVITLYGAVGDMSPLLSQQDIFIGVSRVAMEAAACGCAVILCGNEGYLGILDATSATRAALSNFCCRGEVAASENGLRADLLTLLNDPDERQRCADEARTLIQTHFNAERMCRETLTLYHRARMPKGALHVTVGGYFGCGNAGDDLILQGFLAGMRDAAPDLRVTALTAHPRKNARRFGVPCVSRKNPLSCIRAFLESDAFLCGGGSLLQNATSNRSLLYYLHLLRLSRLCGAHPILYSAGIGPLRGKRARRQAAKTLERCDYISLRDPESMRMLEQIGVSRSLLHVGADMALLAPLPPATRAPSILADHGIAAGTRYFCVILKGGSRAAYEVCRMLAAGARMIAKRHALLPVFFVLDPTHDGRATQVAARVLHAPVIPLREPSDAAALLSAAEFAVTMRLHALVLASCVTIPALGVCADTDDEKIPSFARLCAQDYLTRDALSVGALVERMEALLSDRDRLRPLLADAAADLRKKAKKDLANIVTMLYNSK
ncbi:MAG: glycosyltransferase [Clostridia bacterium]|nr:glycosyltransferase [Clostridia bacterium]MBQ9774360.1 glycosyltransferase [Clostridia bacterium]